MSDADKVRKLFTEFMIPVDHYGEFRLDKFISGLVALIKEAENNGHDQGYEEALSVHEMGERVCSKCKEKVS